MEKTNTGSRKTNNKYKDSVFTRLFSSKKSLFELYKVLHPEDTKVTINDIEQIALENVLLIRRYNDAAMGVRDKLLVLSEHQSTPNPNMPVRLLLYIAEEYEKIIKKNKTCITIENKYENEFMALQRLLNQGENLLDIKNTKMKEKYLETLKNMQKI